MGAGPVVFSVWGYVIANTVGSQVELNPKLLASLIGASEKEVRAAIDLLCSPDAKSRSKVADGRRLLREGEFAYRVPNYEAYKAVQNEDDRRAYNRRKQAESRARRRVNTAVKVSIRESGKSAHEEEEAEEEAEEVKSTTLVALKRDDIVAELHSLSETQKLNGASRAAKAKLVFAYWAAKWNHPQAVFDPRRQARLMARLKENGDDASELLYVVDGSKRDDWDGRAKFSGIEQLFKDRGAVEKFAPLANGFVAGEPHPLAVKYGIGGSGAVG